MESKTLANHAIAKRLEEFILVKLDRNNIDIDDLPPVKFAPTIYLFSQKKELLITVAGYYVIEDFNSDLDDFYKKLK
jgi:hypothetical protein